MMATGAPGNRPLASTANLAIFSSMPFSMFWLALHQGPRARFFEPFAAPRQAWIGQEIFMGVERLFARSRRHSFARAVGQYPIALLIVHEVGDHNLVENLLM